jgi:hypothetical protein
VKNGKLDLSHVLRITMADATETFGAAWKEIE